MSVGPEIRLRLETQSRSPAIPIELSVPPRAWPRNSSSMARSSLWALGDRRQQEKNSSGPMMPQCFLLRAVSSVVLLSPILVGQPAQHEKSNKAQDKTAIFDRHDLTGKWNRVSPFQTYSNVPGGANELQAYILGQAPAPQKLKEETAEAPFTAEGKAKFDKNIPSYGRRITAPMLGNDPQAMCDPWGVPRMLNGQVAGQPAPPQV